MIPVSRRVLGKLKPALGFPESSVAIVAQESFPISAGNL